MQKLKILNSKEVKKLSARFEEHYGTKLSKDQAYLLSEKNKLYMVNKELGNVDDKNIRIDSLGLYIATITDHSVRLSIEGSQILGPNATKNVIELSNFDEWIKGEDLDIDEKLKGPQIVKCKQDFYGCGIAKEGKLLNHVPKERRLN